MKKSSISTIKSLSILWSFLSIKSKRKVKKLLIIMIISALADLSSVGSIIPFLSLITEPEALWNSESLQSTYSFFGFNNSSDLLLPVTFLFGLTCLLSASIKSLNLWLSGKTAASIGVELSYFCFRNTLLQPYEVHLQNNTANVVSSLVIQLDRTVKALNSLLLLLTGAIISFFLLIALFILNWLIATIAIFILGSIYFLLASSSKKRILDNSKLITLSDNSRVNILQEGLGGIREVIMDKTQNLYLKKYIKADKELRRSQAQNAFIAVFPRYAIEGLILILTSFCSYFLIKINTQEASIYLIPILGSIILCAQRLLPSMQLVYANWNGLRGLNDSIYEVVEILNKQCNESIYKQSSRRRSKFKALKLKSVSFGYNNSSKKVLSDISLEIKRGEFVGIIGTTGGGKSTLMDILLGLLKPNLGHIFLNGENLHSKLNSNLLEKWRDSISHVPQNIYLSDSSIIENIAFGVPSEEIDFKKVKLSAEKAQLSQFIESCPDKYQTTVGERGVRLSGGQRQRIGIARALYKDSEILFLDEATSALDVNTEKSLMKELKKMCNDITIVLIAHRLTTIKDCDKIFKIEKGKIEYLKKNNDNN